RAGARLRAGRQGRRHADQECGGDRVGRKTRPHLRRRQGRGDRGVGRDARTTTAAQAAIIVRPRLATGLVVLSEEACGVSGPHQSTPSGRPRARRYGIGFAGKPGLFNAITDVAGVTVGYTTLISGEGPLVVGKGPARTGVTAILPRPRAELATPLFAGIYS